jgi:hypothetical protein
MKILFASFLLILSFQVSFGQDFQEGDYWDSWGEGRQSIWEYKLFTKDDVIKANRLFVRLKELKSQVEWEGEYNGFAEIGESRLRWNSKIGFVQYSFYHTLKHLSYGKTIENEAFLDLVPENVEDKKLTSAYSSKLPSKRLVKVKVGAKHFLVPNNFLREFLEICVGVQTNDEAIYFSWLKIDDLEKKSSIEINVSPQYQYLVPAPIQAKINSVGTRRINRTDEKISYFVGISEGKNKRIKVGMNLFIEDLGEWVEITKINKHFSVGKISRSFYNKIEECWDGPGGNGNRFPCRKINVGQTIRTRINWLLD